MRRALAILIFAPLFSIGCGGAGDCTTAESVESEQSTDTSAPEPDESGLCVEEVDRGSKPIE